jgi:hypothetical protein
MAWTDLIGAGLDFWSAKEAEKGRQKSAALDRQAADARADRIVDLELDKSGSFFDTSGGVETQFGAPAALKARGILSSGDPQRAEQINAFTAAGPNFQLPTLADAQAVIAKDTARQRETVVNSALTNVAKQFNRANRDNNPALLGQYAKNIQDLQGSLRLDEGTNALNLFNKQRQSDIALAGNERRLYDLQAPAPPFAMNPATSNAAAFLAQSPIGQNVADVGGVAFPAAASNALAQYQQRQSQEESSRLLMALLERQLPNQGAGVGPRSAYTI